MKLSSRDFILRRMQGKALPGEIVDEEYGERLRTAMLVGQGPTG